MVVYHFADQQSLGTGNKKEVQKGHRKGKDTEGKKKKGRRNREEETGPLSIKWDFECILK